jgi:superoxide reductase
MNTRRKFLQTALVVAGGMAVSPAKKVFASGNAYTGIVYTAKNPGKWEKKVSDHLPQVAVEGKKVTIQTDHSMSEKHYIVRHTLVSADGKFIGGKVFYPSDKKAVSSYELSEDYGKMLYATSFCNKHDLWVAEVKI